MKQSLLTLALPLIFLEGCFLIAPDHLTAAAHTEFSSYRIISPSAEIGLYSNYYTDGYKSSKIFDCGDQLLLGYQNHLYESGHTISTAYSNNIGLLGLGVYHEFKTINPSKTQKLGGRLMFFGPTYRTILAQPVYFELVGYFGKAWDLNDDSTEHRLGFGVRFHYRLKR